MASILCKNQKGVNYIYGVVSYRRESDKQPRSKMTCLGKIDSNTNKPKYNEKYQLWMAEHGLSVTNSLFDYIIRNNKDIKIVNNTQIKDIETDRNKIDIEDTTRNLPENSYYSTEQIMNAKKYFYGSTYLLNHISNSIGLTKIIEDIFLDDANQIIDLAYFNVIEHKPSMYCKYFALNYNIYSDYQAILSQRISELLNRITEKDKLNFYRSWSSKINENDYLSLDTTSISTYSTNIMKASYGHNKQREKLKQVNICLLFGENSGLPVYTTLYDGSLHDVSTLVCIIDQTSLIQNKSYKLVLDRGFYSQKNINYMLFSDNKADFLISVPGTTSLKNDLIDEHKFIFDNINYAIDINRNKLFGATKLIKWEKNVTLYAHIYVDPIKNDSSRNAIIEDIDLKYKNAIKDPETYKKDPAYRAVLKFRRSFKSPTGYIVKKDQKAYQDIRSKAGWFVLLSNCIDNSKDAIYIYRKRDVIEKSFDILKNFIHQKRTTVHSDINNDNKLFISFISMIIISYIHNVMQENNLYRGYTIDELLCELSSIKAIKIDNDIIIDPLTKKAKDIYDVFKCTYPK
jgi:transposase